MNYLRITRDNIDKEHICCAMSGKQSLAKKEWLKQRFDEGLVFLRSTERGKCFIEYIPAENAWVPIDATGWVYIDCLWVSGALKGHGYAGELLAECIRDARAQGRKGLCILCAKGRKREFLADPKFLEHESFTVADVSDCGITLMALPLDPAAEKPKFKECAKHPKAEESGFVLYYTDQCPFTFYWVPKVEEAAKEHSIPLKTIHITTREAAQDVPAPVTTYALFRDGQFITQGIQSDKKFLALAGIKCQSQTFVGNTVKNPDSYELDMERMNCTDAHTLDLQAGDSLQVTLAIVAGILQLEITAPDGSVLYSGNGTEATHFTVNISQSGRYTIAVKARHAQGRICINKEKV